jgi:hypothetical protein
MKNLSSILTSAITGLVILTCSFVWLAILLLAMNGFSERQAMPVLIFYLILSLLSVVGFGLAGVWFKNSFDRRHSWHIALSSALAILVASIIGFMTVCAASLIAVAIAAAIVSK